MKTFDDIGTARAAHETSGGWLLDLGDGVYQVTDDAGTVCDLREHGEDYLRAHRGRFEEEFLDGRGNPCHRGIPPDD